MIPRAGVGTLDERKYLPLIPNGHTFLVCPSRSLITIMTELPRLLLLNIDLKGGDRGSTVVKVLC